MGKDLLINWLCRKAEADWIYMGVSEIGDPNIVP